MADAACAAATACSPIDGLNFMYTPDWEALAQPNVWLAATGQIFFTLSVGMGSLQAYASYLTRRTTSPSPASRRRPRTRPPRSCWAARSPFRRW